MPTVPHATVRGQLLSVAAYNEARIRSAVRELARNGNPGACREIAGRAEPAPGTHLNTGDSRWVSVTPGPRPARRGGRPRVHDTPAAGNRARQRAYRARRRGQAA
jgi:hypothetical protein